MSPHPRKHAMLVEDSLWACKEYLTVARREETADHRAKTYHSLVLWGKLRMAVQCLTERETGGVLQPGDRCTKAGDRVMDVLRTKHSEAWTPTASLDSYPGLPPELTLVDIMEDTVTAVAGILSGEGRTGGDILLVPATLAPMVWRGKRGVEVDCRGLCRVAW